MRDDISPPPSSKRRKLAPVGPSEGAPECNLPTRLTIYSWNINGIGPFLQKSIASFFQPSGVGNDAESDASPASSLRDVLKRYEWPTMLFLQEVKINPEDSGAQRAVEKAVNPAANEAPGQPLYRAFFVYRQTSTMLADLLVRYMVCVV